MTPSIVNHGGSHTLTARMIMSCGAGNMLEFYEFAMFGYLAIPLSGLFFPSDNSFLSLIMTYLAFACGFIMRPLGALIWGYIGDTWGRKKALTLSLLLMAGPTVLMGCLPTYEQIGLLAPVLLIACRLLQGLSIGGEFTGAAIYLIENAPHNQKGKYSSWGDFGSSLGMICASLTMVMLTYALTQEQLTSWGWRLPFLSAVFLGILGLWIRHKLPDTADFAQIKSKDINPLKKLFVRKYRAPLILTTLFLTINSVGYYFLIIYIPGVNHGAVEPFMISVMTLLNLMANIPGYMISARLSDKWGQPAVLMMGSFGCFMLAYPTMVLTKGTPILAQIICQMAFSFSLGFCFGPRSALMARLFPTDVRYSGVSFGYNMSNAIMGGTAPLICAYLSHNISFTTPAFYTMMACIVSFISLRIIQAKFSP